MEKRAAERAERGRDALELDGDVRVHGHWRHGHVVVHNGADSAWTMASYDTFVSHTTMRDKCPVCLEDDLRLCKPYGCTHGVCSDCYHAWGAKTCPTCRMTRPIRERPSNDWTTRAKQLGVYSFKLPLFDEYGVTVFKHSQVWITKRGFMCKPITYLHKRRLLTWLKRQRVCARAWTPEGRLRHPTTLMVPDKIKRLVRHILK